MKALFELFRRFDARRIFGFIRRLGGMSRPKVECYDLRSTHALRVEGDCSLPSAAEGSDKISIHALRVEGDIGCALTRAHCAKFLSTPSGWRATPCGSLTRRMIPISIHALRVEGDSSPEIAIIAPLHFYPRPPGGGRRWAACGKAGRFRISIHALRVEGDSKNGQSFRLFLRKREKNLPL